MAAAAARVEATIQLDRQLKEQVADALERWLMLQRELGGAARELEQALLRGDRTRGRLRKALIAGFREYDRAVADLPQLDRRLAQVAGVADPAPESSRRSPRAGRRASG